MNNLKSHFQKINQIHHFHVIEYSSKDIFDELKQTFSKFKTDFNFVEYFFDELLVDEARLIIDNQSFKNFKDTQTVYLIFANKINTASQNALLKVLEEPTKGKYFFFVTPQVNNLLPTFISRAVVLKNLSVSEKEKNISLEKNNLETFSYQSLKKMKLTERMKIVTKILADLSKEKITKGDIVSAVNQFTREMNEDFLDKQDEKLIKKIQNISDVTKYLNNQGSSAKSILEYMMLNL